MSFILIGNFLRRYFFNCLFFVCCVFGNMVFIRDNFIEKFLYFVLERFLSVIFIEILLSDNELMLFFIVVVNGGVSIYNLFL